MKTIPIIKKILYPLLYRILLFLGNKFDNQILIRCKLAIGSSLLLLNSGHLQAQTKHSNRTYPGTIAVLQPATAPKDTATHYCYAAVTLPEFPGGEKELTEYLAKGIKRYAYLDSCADGKCIVSFKIDKTGKARDPQIVQALSPDQDTACLRIIKEMPLWTPGKVKDRVVNMKRTVPFIFTGYDPGKMKKNVSITCYVIDIQSAEFPGGSSALDNYITKNATYPPYGQEKEGEVTVSFWIDENGKIFEPVIIKSSDPILNDKALKIISEMPQWKPARYKGNVRCKKTITIPFRKIKKIYGSSLS